jgi:hypothetical protein
MTPSARASVLSDAMEELGLEAYVHAASYPKNAKYVIVDEPANVPQGRTRMHLFMALLTEDDSIVTWDAEPMRPGLARELLSRAGLWKFFEPKKVTYDVHLVEWDLGGNPRPSRDSIGQVEIWTGRRWNSLETELLLSLEKSLPGVTRDLEAVDPGDLGGVPLAQADAFDLPRRIELRERRGEGIWRFELRRVLK